MPFILKISILATSPLICIHTCTQQVHTNEAETPGLVYDSAAAASVCFNTQRKWTEVTDRCWVLTPLI